MNLFTRFRAADPGRRRGVVGADGREAAAGALDRITAEPPRDPTHGDVATNAAMVLAKPLGMKPRELALQHRGAARGGSRRRVRRGRRAGLRQPAPLRRVLGGAARDDPARRHGLRALRHRRAARRSTSNTSRPTRPGRCMSAIAAARSSAMPSPTCSRRPATRSRANTTSTMPARRSMRSPARPTSATARRSARQIGEIPSGLYPGDYLKPVGEALEGGVRRRAAASLPQPEWLPVVRERAIAAMMEMIRADLDLLGIHHDVFFSERSLQSGAVDRVAEAIAALAQKGPDLPGHAAAAEGPGAGGLGGPRADALPLHRVRRRHRPAAAEVGRQLHLFRLRHRLSLRQVSARLPPDDRRARRRPWRLREADEGGGHGDERRRGDARRRASASS